VAKRSRPGPLESGFRYIESSALVAGLLEGDRQVLEALRGSGLPVTSALTLTEAARAILRARVTGRLDRTHERAAVRALRSFGRRAFVVSVSDSVLRRAGAPFPVEPIRTLDAVHLATAELLDDSPSLVTFVTRDARTREYAIAMGYAVE